MAVATIKLTSPGDSVVVSAPNDEYKNDEIILDTDPKGLYATGFKLRTQSGAFEPGGRIIGEQVPIREMMLPVWLTPESRPRFQKLWGTPGNFHKVRYDYDGPSGLRWLTLRLSKEIEYLTEDGFDADIDDVYHGVAVALAVNPNFESLEDAAEWRNPDERFILTIQNVFSGTYRLTWTPTGGTGAQTAVLQNNANLATVTAAVQGLAGVGAGNVTVTSVATTNGVGYRFVFAKALSGTLTGTSQFIGGTLGLGAVFKIDYASNVGWFDVWNPTDQPLWLEWEFDPARSWWFPDWAFGQERKWNRAVGQDAARMIVTPRLTQLLSVMADPFMDTYVNADLSNAAGLFNGVEPMYMVPPYTGSEDDPVVMPVVCYGPKGARVTLRQRRFWSAESGLEQ